MAAHTHGDGLQMSMRDKSVLKRRVNKEHNSNFRAGYVHINENQLHKTGIRGRKRYLLYILIALLVLLAFGNLLVNIIVLLILRIDHTGMASMEFIPYSELLRFTGKTEMDSMLLPGNSIASHGDQSLEFSADNKEVKLSVPGGGMVQISPEGTTITAKDGLRFLDPAIGKQIFSTELDTENFKIPENLSYLDLQKADSSKFTSGVEEDFSLESDMGITLQGNEGIHIEGKKVVINAKKALELNEKFLEFNGANGVVMEQVRKFPYPANNLLDSNVETHRICVCMPSGKLFLVPNPNTCAEANEVKNPCE